MPEMIFTTNIGECCNLLCGKDNTDYSARCRFCKVQELFDKMKALRVESDTMLNTIKNMKHGETK